MHYVDYYGEYQAGHISMYVKLFDPLQIVTSRVCMDSINLSEECIIDLCYALMIMQENDYI